MTEPTKEDRERAEAFLTKERYGEDTEEFRKYLRAMRADSVHELMELFAAVRKEECKRVHDTYSRNR